MTDLQHKLSNDAQVEINGKWLPAIGLPFFTTKGLPIWRRFNEKNWRPECACGRIFETLEDYEAHIVYKNSPYSEPTNA